MDKMLEATARAEETHFWFRGLRRNARLLLEEALDRKHSLRILDCGTGTGRNLDWLSEYGAATGVERADVGLAVARTRRRRVVQATVAALPFADASVDIVTSFDVLYCLDDEVERAAVREMWRVVRPGGVLIVNVAALDVLRGAHSTLTMERRRYTPARLTALLTGAGFVVTRMTFTNLTTFPLTLAVRVADRVTGRVHQASDADLRVPPAPINAALSAATAMDGWLLRFMNLPIGTSLMCVARKTRA
jgi:SAM-dependent methyltransferase